MALTLYKHNQYAYEKLNAMLSVERRAAIIHPTGTGKSFIAFKFCEGNKDKTIAWLSPSEYIFNMQCENLVSAGSEVPSNIKFFTYAKLVYMQDSEIEKINADYIILDEFHRAGASVWGAGVERVLSLNPLAKVIGFSATAIRYLDNQRNMADELFENNIASEMTLGEAIVRGILAPPKYVTTLYSFSDELEKYSRKVNNLKNMSQKERAEKILQELRRKLQNADGLDVIFKKHMENKSGKFIVFCSNLEHLQEMKGKCNEFFSRINTNINKYVVYSEGAKSEIEFNAFKNDKSDSLKLLFSIDMLNEGVHVGDIDGVILFRPTVSPILYKQQIGRALSCCGSENAVIFDIVNNIENLYSINATIDEAKIFLSTYENGADSEDDYHGKFKVFDEIKDCKILFESLNDALTVSWEKMFESAKAYYNRHGDLVVPKRYKTKEGYSLGTWIMTQRMVASGQVSGVLTSRQMELLDTIGMVWEQVSDYNFDTYLSEAKKYFSKNGDLLVPAGYVTDNGINLGSFIASLRNKKKAKLNSKFLTTDRIKSLEKLGMVWDVNNSIFEKFFASAEKYKEQNGDLLVPLKFVDESGVKLGHWINQIKNPQRKAYLSESQIQKLNDIGMVWESNSDRLWHAHFEDAREYYLQNGNLSMAVAYETQDGFKLGAWLADQRALGDKIKKERKKLLDTIGMVWEKGDSWQDRFDLAKEYYESNGHLNMPSNYKVQGVWLAKWLSEQKLIYEGKRQGKSLSIEQIDLLKSIGFDFLDKTERAWKEQFNEFLQFYEQQHTIKIPQNYIGSNGKKIGLWLSRQLTLLKKGELDSNKSSLILPYLKSSASEVSV